MIAAQVMLDVVIINASMLFAQYLNNNFEMFKWQWTRFERLWPMMTLACLLSFTAFRMYKSLWRYAGLNEAVRIVLGALVGVGLTYAYSLLSVFYNFVGPPKLDWVRARQMSAMMPQSTYVTMWLTLSVLAGASRFSVRIINQLGVQSRALEKDRRTRVLIIGAGWGGAQVVRQLQERGFREGMPVALVDDDPSKAGTRIGSVPVLYDVSMTPVYAQKYGAEEIIIAIPSASPQRLREIMAACTVTQCKLRMASGLRDVTNGALQMGEIRDVNIADLLFRDEVELDMNSIHGYLQDRVVLVTGGGGSIGSELCRQIMIFKPKRLIIFDIYENNAFDLCGELKEKYGRDADILVLIGSVRDKRRLEEVFFTLKPDVVFHAAAHKHVPLMEFCPAEAVKNNVFGTLNVAHCADKFGVKRMVTLSTDKAVNPANVMGASKRVTEMIIQYMAKRSKTRYMAVRFGNVLGSNGSVIPIFMRQIKAGGPLTLMHEEITRYFMTIPEASQLVLQAGAIGESGNIFVLDMGTPVKIIDLARNLIRLSGLRPDVDIKIEVVGLRPGEKLYEELVMKEEQDTLSKTGNEKIFVLHPPELDDSAFEVAIDGLRNAVETSPFLVRELLHNLVPTFVEAETAPRADDPLRAAQ